MCGSYVDIYYTTKPCCRSKDPLMEIALPDRSAPPLEDITTSHTTNPTGFES